MKVWMDDASSLADAVRRREVRAADALEASLDAIQRSELNTVVTLDAEGARRQAEVIDERLSRGEDPGLFAGVPLLVKDVEDAAGMPTSHGSLVFKDKVAERDCTHVERLRAAGAVIVGKAATSEFGFVAYTATIPDRFAGMWWDRARAVMTVRLTGDDIENHRRALEDAAGEDMAVCVSGGADYSEAALIDIQRRVFDLIDREATAMWASSVGALTNRVEVMVEYLDGATRALVESEFGDAVVFEAFVEVLEGTIADLPAQEPAHPGDVKLLTQSNRAGGGMQALGTFEVAFDQDLGCVFFPGDESSPDGRGRIVPVWPFGYTAESNPLRIYDQDGELVAEEGDVIQMGGGFVEHVTENELCGAGGAWIMSSHPEIVNP